VEIEHSTTITNSDEESTSVSLSLGDPDIYDEFVVDIYYDNTYGTFIFNTVAGRSKCVHETMTSRSEDPRLAMSNRASSFIYPKEKMVFEVEMSNLGQSPDSFFYIAQEAGSKDLLARVDGGGGTVNENGHIIQLYKDKSVTKQIEIMKGYLKYEFPAIQLTLKSKCEADMNIRQNPKEGMYTTITLANAVNSKGEQVLRWIEPCPQVHWAGDLRRDKTFLFNTMSASDGVKNSLTVTLFNPLYIKGKNMTKLGMDGPLEEVLLKYRKLGTSSWKPGITDTPSTEPMNYLSSTAYEDTYGFSSLQWLLEGIAEEGEYEITLATKCTSAVNAPEEVKGFQESIITGIYDVTRPAQYGEPIPLRRDIVVGEEISVFFTEDMLCTLPFTFEIRVTIEGTSYNDLDKRYLHIICEGKRIGFQFDWGQIDPSVVVGKEFEVEIGALSNSNGDIYSSLRDKNDNPMDPLKGNIKFQKRFASLNLSNATSVFEFEIDNSNCTKESLEVEAEEIRTTIASIIGIAEIERVQVLQMTCQGNSKIVARTQIKTNLDNRMLKKEERNNFSNSASLFYQLSSTLKENHNQGRTLQKDAKHERIYGVRSMFLVPDVHDNKKFKNSPKQDAEQESLLKWGSKREEYTNDVLHANKALSEWKEQFMEHLDRKRSEDVIQFKALEKKLFQIEFERKNEVSALERERKEEFLKLERARIEEISTLKYEIAFIGVLIIGCICFSKMIKFFN